MFFSYNVLRPPMVTYCTGLGYLLYWPMVTFGTGLWLPLVLPLLEVTLSV
jgi:hypothetical protein